MVEFELSVVLDLLRQTPGITAEAFFRLLMSDVRGLDEALPDLEDEIQSGATFWMSRLAEKGS